MSQHPLPPQDGEQPGRFGTGLASHASPGTEAAWPALETKLAARRRKRRALWLWLPILTALVGLGGGALWYSNHNRDSGTEAIALQPTSRIILKSRVDKPIPYYAQGQTKHTPVGGGFIPSRPTAQAETDVKNPTSLQAQALKNGHSSTSRKPTLAQKELLQTSITKESRTKPNKSKSGNSLVAKAVSVETYDAPEPSVPSSDLQTRAHLSHTENNIEENDKKINKPTTDKPLSTELPRNTLAPPLDDLPTQTPQPKPKSDSISKPTTDGTQALAKADSTVTPIQADRAKRPRSLRSELAAAFWTLFQDATRTSTLSEGQDRLEKVSRLLPTLGLSLEAKLNIRLSRALSLKPAIGVWLLHQRVELAAQPGPNAPYNLLYSADSSQILATPTMPVEPSRSLSSSLLRATANAELCLALTPRLSLGAGTGWAWPVGGGPRQAGLAWQSTAYYALRRLGIQAGVRYLPLGAGALPGLPNAQMQSLGLNVGLMVGL